MLAAALVLAMLAQAGEDVVVTGRRGRAALLWDMRRDGLRNCRLFRSSGNRELDATACLDLPPAPERSEPSWDAAPPPRRLDRKARLTDPNRNSDATNGTNPSPAGL
jgi:hypothetical protein